MLTRTTTATAVLFVALAAGQLPVMAAPPATPAIRTSESNPVPACVTPDRLMTFLKSRNRNLDPRFADIARHYKSLGEGWRVRWDYAFFQMAVETNFLTYRRPDGRMGDVDPRQNNFAGIGTTGGGVPGDSYPDVRTGVLAQIQHLVAYSGERLAEPVAPRTQLKQDVIVAQSLGLGREVRFADLSRRWAVDKNYGRSISWVAGLYTETYCTGRYAVPDPAPAPKSKPAAQLRNAAAPAAVPPPKPASRPASAVRTVWTAEGGNIAKPATAEPTSSKAANLVAPSGLGMKPAVAAAPAGAEDGACTIRTASYGGAKTFLIRSEAASRTTLTALTVLDGFEKSMTEKYIATRQPGGTAVGEFKSRDDALAKAREACPAG